MIKYNEFFANNVRQRLANFEDVEEKFMFNCLAFMVNGKLCIGIRLHEVFFRIDPNEVPDVIDRNGCSQMMHGKISMKGYVMVENEALSSSELNFWMELALAYNPLARSSKSGKARRVGGAEH